MLRLNRFLSCTAALPAVCRQKDVPGDGVGIKKLKSEIVSDHLSIRRHFPLYRKDRGRWFRRYPARHEHLAWSVIRTWETVVISKLTGKAALAFNPSSVLDDSAHQLI
jgi:hypothetical protein